MPLRPTSIWVDLWALCLFAVNRQFMRKVVPRMSSA